MKIGFFAFTGTGNTLRVCKILAKELEQNEIVCDIKLIKQVVQIFYIANKFVSLLYKLVKRICLKYSVLLLIS